MNSCAPARIRREVEGVLVDFDPVRYQVDAEGIPGLVARGVMDFGWMLEREDFAKRFFGCSEASHVRDVLFSEGSYARPEGEWREDHDRRAKAARARVKKRRQRAG